MKLKSLFRIGISVSLFLLFLLVGASPALSAVIQLNQSLSERKIGLDIEYLEDKPGVIVIEDLVARKHEDRWVASQRKVPSFGFTKSVYWTRFTIENTTDDEIAFFLEQYYCQIDYLTFYEPQEDGTFKVVQVACVIS